VAVANQAPYMWLLAWTAIRCRTAGASWSGEHQATYDLATAKGALALLDLVRVGHLGVRLRGHRAGRAQGEARLPSSS
jgi:hypothetical protein